MAQAYHPPYPAFEERPYEARLPIYAYACACAYAYPRRIRAPSPAIFVLSLDHGSDDGEAACIGPFGPALRAEPSKVHNGFTSPLNLGRLVDRSCIQAPLMPVSTHTLTLIPPLLNLLLFSALVALSRTTARLVRRFLATLYSALKHGTVIY